ncbi:hypothetical protein K443DRAFT_8556 [Laccaria amethystina LaAM-08-1]|uniref:Uncharacterized protein n=1 Tax=Laccaria amethystina LaAM-08-1 TaxID=1095629 RepID=A0A0C9XNZ6_9AGAR|nr:hypothetical protein K443DRAFT_8556 [Laccaria amethystina LaAM-08-1]
MTIGVHPNNSLAAINGPIADCIRDPKKWINSFPGFELYMDWNECGAKACVFQMLAQVVYLIDHASSKKQLEPNVHRLETWLYSKKQSPDLAKTSAAARCTMGIYCRIIAHPIYGAPITKSAHSGLSTIEFMGICLLIFRFKDMLSDCQMSHAIDLLRYEARINGKKNALAMFKHVLDFVYKRVPVSKLNTDENSVVATKMPLLQSTGKPVTTTVPMCVDASASARVKLPSSKRKRVEVEESDDDDDVPLSWNRKAVAPKRRKTQTVIPTIRPKPQSYTPLGSAVSSPRSGAITYSVAASSLSSMTQPMSVSAPARLSKPLLTRKGVSSVSSTSVADDKPPGGQGQASMAGMQSSVAGPSTSFDRQSTSSDRLASVCEAKAAAAAVASNLASSKSLPVSSKPISTVLELVLSVSKLPSTSSIPTSMSSKPIPTSSKPISTSSKPLSTMSKAIPTPPISRGDPWKGTTLCLQNAKNNALNTSTSTILASPVDDDDDGLAKIDSCLVYRRPSQDQLPLPALETSHLVGSNPNSSTRGVNRVLSDLLSGRLSKLKICTPSHGTVPLPPTPVSASSGKQLTLPSASGSSPSVVRPSSPNSSPHIGGIATPGLPTPVTPNFTTLPLERRVWGVCKVVYLEITQISTLVIMSAITYHGSEPDVKGTFTSFVVFVIVVYYSDSRNCQLQVLRARGAHSDSLPQLLDESHQHQTLQYAGAFNSYDRIIRRYIVHVIRDARTLTLRELQLLLDGNAQAHGHF